MELGLVCCFLGFLWWLLLLYVNVWLWIMRILSIEIEKVNSDMLVLVNEDVGFKLGLLFI